MMSAGFDVVTMGRANVDIFPLEVGIGLAEVAAFGKYLGGTPANVAVAAARLGRRSALIARTGAGPAAQRSMSFSFDPAHAWVRDALASDPIDARLPLTSA